MTSGYIKVQGQPTLVRDAHTGAIVDTDAEGYKAYIESRDRKLSLERRVDDMEDKLDLILKILQGKT